MLELKLFSNSYFSNFNRVAAYSRVTGAAGGVYYFFNNFFSYGFNNFFSLSFLVATASEESSGRCYSEHEDVLFHLFV